MRNQSKGMMNIRYKDFLLFLVRNIDVRISALEDALLLDLNGDRNAIFSCAASGVLQSLLHKDGCSLNMGPLSLQCTIGSISILFPPLPSAHQKHHYLSAMAN